jgi:hypothetical protein
VVVVLEKLAGKAASRETGLPPFSEKQREASITNLLLMDAQLG